MRSYECGPDDRALPSTSHSAQGGDFPDPRGCPRSHNPVQHDGRKLLRSSAGPRCQIGNVRAHQDFADKKLNIDSFIQRGGYCLDRWVMIPRPSLGHAPKPDLIEAFSGRSCNLTHSQCVTRQGHAATTRLQVKAGRSEQSWTSQGGLTLVRLACPSWILSTASQSVCIIGHSFQRR
jgi:hypothetical protein